MIYFTPTSQSSPYHEYPFLSLHPFLFLVHLSFLYIPSLSVTYFPSTLIFSHPLKLLKILVTSYSFLLWVPYMPPSFLFSLHRMFHKPFHHDTFHKKLYCILLYHHCTPPMILCLHYYSSHHKYSHISLSSFSLLTSPSYRHASRTLTFLSSSLFHNHFAYSYSLILFFTYSMVSSSSFSFLVLSFLRLHHFQGWTSSPTTHYCLDGHSVVFHRHYPFVTQNHFNPH